jgi:hypothetical protein
LKLPASFQKKTNFGPIPQKKVTSDRICHSGLI